MRGDDPRLRGLLRAAAAEAVRAGDDPLDVIDGLIAEAERQALAKLQQQISAEMSAARVAAAAEARAELQFFMKSPPGRGSLDERRAAVARRMARLADVVAEIHPIAEG